MNVKFILKLVFLALFISGFSQQKEKINTQWVNSKSSMRRIILEQNRPNELDRFDENTIAELKKKDYSEIEDEVAKLLKAMLIDKPYHGFNNAAEILKMLANDFKEKKYFFDLLYSISNLDLGKNHYVLAEALNGLAKNLGYDMEKTYLIMNVLMYNIDIYIVDPQREGTRVVIPNLIYFMRMYLKAVEDKKIEDKMPLVIQDIYVKLGFAKKSSAFDNYMGAKELKQEYFFYSESKKEKETKKEEPKTKK